MRITFFLLAALLLVAGCGGGADPVGVHPVTGKVVYSGKPAAGVHVFFYPVTAPTIPQIPMNPRGLTDADGRFTLSTYGEGDGAPEGGYQVILLWPQKNEPGEESDTDRLFGWYDAAHSKLKAEVKAGPNILKAFELEAKSGPPMASQGVPGRN